MAFRYIRRGNKKPQLTPYRMGIGTVNKSIRWEMPRNKRASEIFGWLVNVAAPKGVKLLRIESIRRLHISGCAISV